MVLSEPPMVTVMCTIPVPLRLTVWGLPAPLSVTLNVPLRGPDAEGVKVTLILQLPPAANVVPQLLVCAKSPLAEMPVMVSGPVPLFVRVTVCAALVVPMFCPAKVRLVGDRPAEGTVPVPLRLAVCGLPAALSVTLTVPVRVPVADGVKVTLMLQLLPAASVLPQLLVCAKSLLAAMLAIASDPVPLLLRVRIPAAEVVPRF